MLSRKVLERREAVIGRQTMSTVSCNLQLAEISIGQGLFEEAEERASAALLLATQIEGPRSLAAGACHHILAVCG